MTIKLAIINNDQNGFGNAWYAAIKKKSNALPIPSCCCFLQMLVDQADFEALHTLIR